jgi:dTDP-4-dehydrorhamnose reductase
MRVLLAGVTGQVGGALVAPLRSIGTVVTADRSELDLARPEHIAAALERIAPDLIVNPAAYTAVDRAEDERELAFRVNAEAPGAIAQWAAGRGVPLIHFSTDYVFDGSGTRPWREDDPTGPLSAYGASKLAGEQAVRAAGGPHLIVRTSWVYAARGTNFLRTIARLARERTELRIVADQCGAPTSARLIANAVAGIIGDAAIFSPPPCGEGVGGGLAARFAAAGGLVHLAAAGKTSWHGFATAIVAGLRARGVALTATRVAPIATADYPTRAKRPANSRLDLTRLDTAFGITPPGWDVALDAELDRLAGELANAAMP